MGAPARMPREAGVSPPLGKPARFFLWCAGADPDLLTETSERRWYTSLGASVALTAVLAAAAMSVLVSVCFPTINPVMVLLVALFWGALVFNIDRLIVSKVPSDPSKLTKVGLYSARFVMALIIAATVSEGIILTVFAPEVQRQVDTDNQQIIRDAETEARARFQTELDQINSRAAGLENAVATAKRDVDDAARYFGCEVNPNEDCVGVTGEPGMGAEAAEAQAELREAREQQAAMIGARNYYMMEPQPVSFTAAELATCGRSGAEAMSRYGIELCQVELKIAEAAQSATANVDNANGLLKRIIALTNLGNGENGTTVWAARILIFLALTTIELVPLTSKVFGGVSSHDAKVRLAAFRREPHFLDRDLSGFNNLGRSGWGPKWTARDHKKNYYAELFAIQERAIIEQARANAALGAAEQDWNAAQEREKSTAQEREKSTPPAHPDDPSQAPTEVIARQAPEPTGYPVEGGTYAPASVWNEPGAHGTRPWDRGDGRAF
jgi:hypothetical protein